jgi:hypothetical protein
MAGTVAVRAGGVRLGEHGERPGAFVVGSALLRQRDARLQPRDRRRRILPGELHTAEHAACLCLAQIRAHRLRLRDDRSAQALRLCQIAEGETQFGFPYAGIEQLTVGVYALEDLTPLGDRLLGRSEVARPHVRLAEEDERVAGDHDDALVVAEAQYLFELLERRVHIAHLQQHAADVEVLRRHPLHVADTCEEGQ